VVFFLAETGVSDADVVLSHEHVAFAFLPYEEAVKRVTFAGARQVLRAAHDASECRRRGRTRAILQ